MGMRNKKYLLLLSIIFLCGCGESDTPSEEPLKDQKTESIKENKKQMDDLVKILLEKETVEQEEFANIMGDKIEEKKEEEAK